MTVTPGALCLVAVFIWLASPKMAAALLLAAVCHELGHYLVLRWLGASVKHLRICIWGAEMEISGEEHLSYGGELLAVLAGPAVNLLLAITLGMAGQWAEDLYLFAGAHGVLGLFNLLPVRPLDGGAALWLVTAWLTEPFTADRAADAVSIVTGAVLLVCGILLLGRGGSPFLLLAATGLLGQKILVKWKRNR